MKLSKTQRATLELLSVGGNKLRLGSRWFIHTGQFNFYVGESTVRFLARHRLIESDGKTGTHTITTAGRAALAIQREADAQIAEQNTNPHGDYNVGSDIAALIRKGDVQ